MLILGTEYGLIRDDETLEETLHDGECAIYTKLIKIRANSKGTMLLLRVQLIEYHDKYMMLGDIPSYAYENFMEMYDAYHALSGNGMITKMMHEIEELHLKKKEV